MGDDEAQAGPDLGVGPHLGTRQSMTAENLKTRMRNPRFGVVYRNFQLSWVELRRKVFTKPLDLTVQVTLVCKLYNEFIKR